MSRSIDITKTKWFLHFVKTRKPGDVLWIRRTNIEMSQEELGKRIGVSKQIISDLEKGKRTITIPMAEQFSDIFDIDYREFLYKHQIKK